MNGDINFIKAAYFMRNILGTAVLSRRIEIFFVAIHCLTVKMKPEECGLRAA